MNGQKEDSGNAFFILVCLMIAVLFVLPPELDTLTVRCWNWQKRKSPRSQSSPMKPSKPWA